MNSRFFSINDYFKKTYGRKFVKLALDAGFTCPNRDGTLSRGGCIFCSESGSGEFAGHVGRKGVYTPLALQAEAQKKLLNDKWQGVGYLAYLQNYSNSYAAPETLDAIYTEALELEGVEGLVIGTRPDCIDDRVIEVFERQRRKGIFWVELGLQTMHDRTAKWLNRGYELQVFEAVYQRLQQAEIPAVLHLIVGFPGETLADFLETVTYVSGLKPFGVKFHMLNVLKGTRLAALYEKAPFELLDEATYISWLTEAIGRLDPGITVHRLTGDGAKEALIEPKWIGHKRSVLNGIQKSLKAQGVTQGSKVLEKAFAGEDEQTHTAGDNRQDKE